ncbi:unnamed protein product [Brassicogethes aeneus]|uniref:Uncharacterized protein n=1 Tax=Brassicogethes aeneus TaxID=1431903 RepID=A0A9P0FFS6_BRAAE|nr:unnamed protein product [Brassicogethes aeneus]
MKFPSELLQHHFAEVVNALNDEENYEIFTKTKKNCKLPKVQQTIVQLIQNPSQSDEKSLQSTSTEGSKSIYITKKIGSVPPRFIDLGKIKKRRTNTSSSQCIGKY